MPRSSKAAWWRSIFREVAKTEPPYLVAGIDPDLHTPGMALARYSERSGTTVMFVAVPSLPKTLKGQQCPGPLAPLIWRQLEEWGSACDVAVVEGQQVNRDTPNAQSIIDLAQAGGAAVACAQFHCGLVAVPSPSGWKGGVPKGIHHARICSLLGWSYRMAGSKTDKSKQYAVPDEEFGLQRSSDWKHAMDAVGLALWGIEEILREQKLAGL